MFLKFLLRLHFPFKVFFLDIIRPKNWLCSVFSRYWVMGWIPNLLKSFCFVPIFFYKMGKIQGGAKVL